MADDDPIDELTRAVAAQAAPLPACRLRVARGPDRGLEATLEGAELHAGTQEGCDLRLTDPTVSRSHFALEPTPGGFRLRDLGSTNGTFVEGVRIVEAVLPGAATITCGRTEVRLRPLGERLQPPVSEAEAFGPLLGRSLAMRRIFHVLERVAPTDATVLLTGETGTGKDVAAEAIHLASARRDGPLVVVDCAAVPPALMESELFGHEKGAFTGAVATRAGAFEEAHGGTVFLDEIGELPPPLQPKLLRLVEKRQVKRVGANVVRAVDVRIVAATNRDLRAEINRGAFREDLYWRLGVVRVRLPPLRERREDVPLLVSHFARQLGGESTGSAVPAELMASFLSHPWPGNVRELRNAVERALAVGGGAALDDEDAASLASGAIDECDPSVPFKTAKERLLCRFERAYLERLLADCRGNLSQAARQAGLDRVYLLKLARRHGLRGG